MTKSLLIVSADTTFAQVLLHGLEQEGYRRSRSPKARANPLSARMRTTAALAFLDMDLGYRAVLEIGQALRMLKPEIKLVVFSRDEIPPAFDELHPWMLSRKPYFLPEVLNMINDNYTPSSKSTGTSGSRPGVQTSDPALPWLRM